TALSARMLNRCAHERVGQFLLDHLARYRLQDLHDGGKIKVFHWGHDCVYRTRLLLAEVRVQLIELPHLAIGAPTGITVSCVPQIRMCDLLKTTCCVESRGELIGERFILDKAVRV